MNILIINHYAGSPDMGMEFRPYYLAREWQKLGHKVLIVGGTYSHLRKKQPQKAGSQIIDGIEYLWLKTPPYHGNGVKRFLSMLMFTAKLWCMTKKIVSTFHPDAVIASSTYPLDNYPARRIARKSGGKYIYEIHDLWPLSPMELGGMSKRHPFIVMMQKAENYAYRHCDSVVSILPKAKEHCMAHGLPKNRFFHVPNGIVEEDWNHPEPLPDEHKGLIAKLRDEGRFLVGFAGAHGLANSLGTLIDAALLLKDDNISVLLVGTGQEKENLMRYVSEKGADNVFFLPPVSKFAVPEFLKRMDVLYIGLQRQSLFRFGISPNKIFDYMMAAKPIINAIEAGNDPVSEAGCGISVPAENPPRVADAIAEMQAMSEEERRKMGKNGQAYILKNHTYSVLANSFIEIIETLVKGNNP